MPNAKTGEIDLFEIDTSTEGFYEVEIWNNGNCNGHFFRWKRQALQFFEQHARKAPDCIKYHEAEENGGTCQLIKEARQ